MSESNDVAEPDFEDDISDDRNGSPMIGAFLLAHIIALVSALIYFLLGGGPWRSLIVFFGVGNIGFILIIALLALGDFFARSDCDPN